ncbi:hypothetical protein JTE90_025629 [Oedothorax gibbosus]|uniref:ATP-dependent (S)-NAD(P)H-hydrate dehydratase n=1 Tax=Oedothorax gibbosus TaxID=931172 RepID=A0AAV6V9G2_9ARAC|nr:hypothetical protein JTE90_025629 [Oedothorax gibbosus]
MDWIKEIISIIPPLSFDSHKGQAGRIGIVGGSENYTGAPYFAAISALKVGCDLSHVFCTPDASQVIKSYSPELIVHPIIGSPNIYEEMQKQLPYLHSLVIGPGLGREKTTFHSTSAVIESAVKHGLPLVFDADALFYLNEHHGEIAWFDRAILTPNKVEFSRLYSSVTGDEITADPSTVTVKYLAKKLGFVTIVAKGRQDIISDGNTVVVCDEPGSPKRCGGQGDLLSGALGVFNFWARQAKLNVSCQPTVLAAMAACMLTRRCGYLAFQKFKRSTLTTDMIGEINEAFSSLYT